MFNPYDDFAGSPTDMMGGGMVTGKWTNRRTGQTVLVRDCIMVDEGMAIMLSDGSSINMEEFSRDYFQMSDEEYDMNGNVSQNASPSAPGAVSGRVINPSSNSKPTTQPIPVETFESEYVAEDMFAPKQQNFYEDVNINSVSTPQKSTNYDLIDKLFTNKNPNIKLDFAIQSENFPVNELKMLIDVFGVDVSEISKYIVNKYLSMDEIVTYVDDTIYDILGIDKKEDSSLEIDEI